MNLVASIPLAPGEKIKFSSRVARNGSVAWRAGRSPGLGIKTVGKAVALESVSSCAKVALRSGGGEDCFQLGIPSCTAFQVLYEDPPGRSPGFHSCLTHSPPFAPNGPCGPSQDWLFSSPTCLQCTGPSG